MSKYSALYEDFPKLLSLLRFGVECGGGWHELIYDLCDKIDAYNKEMRAKIRVTQIKEKYGTLRFYVDAAPDLVFDWIGDAERLSEITCEQCGERGSFRTETNWLLTRCDECHEAKQPIPTIF